MAGRLLVLGTRNRGKVAELEELLAGTGWEVRALPDEVPEHEETGTTFADNARDKALAYARATGLPTLADDSGLQIDALGGEPGVYSARYVDAAMPQPERNLAVLAKLRGVPGPARGARFVCHLALACNGAVVHECTGTCEGRIGLDGEVPRGEGGFGYDPIFEVPELGRTFAELSRAEKSARSHRGHAVRAMVRFLRDWRPGN